MRFPWNPHPRFIWCVQKCHYSGVVDMTFCRNRDFGTDCACSMADAFNGIEEIEYSN